MASPGPAPAPAPTKTALAASEAEVTPGRGGKGSAVPMGNRIRRPFAAEPRGRNPLLQAGRTAREGGEGPGERYLRPTAPPLFPTASRNERAVLIGLTWWIPARPRS
jgi:hypothetical protein